MELEARERWVVYLLAAAVTFLPVYFVLILLLSMAGLPTPHPVRLVLAGLLELPALGLLLTMVLMLPGKYGLNLNADTSQERRLLRVSFSAVKLTFSTVTFIAFLIAATFSFPPPTPRASIALTSIPCAAMYTFCWMITVPDAQIGSFTNTASATEFMFLAGVGVFAAVIVLSTLRGFWSLLRPA